MTDQVIEVVEKVKKERPVRPQYEPINVVVGFDGGNDTSKVVWAIGQKDGDLFMANFEGRTSFANELQMHYSMSSYLQSSNNKNGRSLANRDGQVIQWGDYVLATGTQISGKVGINHKTDFDKYNDEYYMPLLASALACVADEVSLKEYQVMNVYLFCTCQITGKSDVAAWIKRVAPTIKRIKTIKGTHLINIQDVVVHAEPVGTALYFLWETRDLSRQMTDYIILDFGGLTTDALRFSACGNDMESISNTAYVSVPFSCNQLIREVKNYLVKKSKQYADHTPDVEIVRAIQRLSAFGVDKDSVEAVGKEIGAIVDDFINTVISSLEKALGGKKVEHYDGVIITGGGASMLEKHFSKYNDMLTSVNCKASEFSFNNALGAFAVYQVAGEE